METKNNSNFNFTILGQIQGQGGHGGMTVSVYTGGVNLSVEASRFFTKGYIEIGYDEKKKAIAIKPSEETQFSKKIKKRGNNILLCCRKLVKLIEKDAGDRKKSPCRWDEKEQMLIFNLEGEK